MKSEINGLKDLEVTLQTGINPMVVSENTLLITMVILFLIQMGMTSITTHGGMMVLTMTEMVL
jgi:hypothetical protein